MNEKSVHDIDYIVDGSYHIRNGRLNYIGHEITRCPEVFNKLHANRITCLDLSHNCITTLVGIDKFPLLTELILDNNYLSDLVNIPCMPSLQTLSLNNNFIEDIEQLVKQLKQSLPNLEFLSLLGNRACPNELSDSTKDETDYQRYRFYVLHYLRTLKFLDYTPVTAFELREAAIKGQFMRIKRPKIITEERNREDEIIRNRYTPLPPVSRALGEHTGAYSVFRYRYSTKESEGNRFIYNKDL